LEWLGSNSIKHNLINEEAIEVFKQEMGKKYPSHDEKIRYRLWKDQDQRCAYSGNLGRNKIAFV
jgi:CRISPR/Cas system Type II protein with McrA/HNH and RuvC-like nuclease domain